MLNFIKTVFNTFAENNFGGNVGNLIVTRQHIDSPHTPIGYCNDRNDLIDIVAIKGNNFYQIISDVDIIGRLGNGISYDDRTKMFYLDTPIFSDHVIIFQTDSNRTLNFTSLFNSLEINLVSIDYVGSDVGYVSPKGCNPDTFIEADMSNLYDYDTKSLTGINLELGQNIYFGNHNAISLGVNPFNVKKIILPNSDSETYIIPPNCFAGCTNLLEVVIPDCVTEIGEGAFSGCTNLQTVYIGSGVINIGTKAFNKCSNIVNFFVDRDNPKYIGLKGCLLSKNTTIAYTYTLVFANKNWWSNQYSADADMKNIYTSFLDYGHQTMPDTINYSDGVNKWVGCMDLQLGVVVTGYSPLLDYSDYELVDGFAVRGDLVTSSNFNYYYTHLPSPGTIADYCITPVYYWITEIEPDACSNDPEITSVDLSKYKSLATIGQNAFKGCANMTNLTLPDTYVYTDASRETGGYSGSIMINIAIGASAFEGCARIGSLTFKQSTTLGDRAFFGCTSAESISFNGTQYTHLVSIGNQTFSNMPNLGSITTNLLGGILSDTFKIVTWVDENHVSHDSHAIYVYANEWHDYTNCIVVGCKNTSMVAIMKELEHTNIVIADYAFYGCRQYNPEPAEKDCFYITPSQPYHIDTIGNYAFYGCTSLVLTGLDHMDIKDSAFYGCTSIVDIGSSECNFGPKCFANSGIKHIRFTYICSLADNAFEGCTLETVEIDDSYNTCAYSTSDSENSILKKHVSTLTSPVTILKSGNGKEIVNTTWYDANAVITDIKDNAFTGVNMNNGTNTTIHIPRSVTNVGKNILARSKFNNDVTGGSVVSSLMLDTSSTTLSQITCGPSMALLWAIGAKYFKEAIVRTQNSRITDTNHYYDITIDNIGYKITMNEVGPNIDRTKVCTISYSDTGIKANIMARLLPGYYQRDPYSHIEILTQPIDILLMAKDQTFNQTEQGVYLDSDLVAAAGSSWQGYNIPNDFSIVTGASDSYNTFTNISDYAFADCKWFSKLKIGRRISGNNMFNGCTKLTTVSANSGSGECDYNIFDGVIQNGMFDGCTSLTGIVHTDNSSYHPIPIIIKQKAFKGCISLNADEILSHATEIDANAFEDTGLANINLYSAESIDATAFVGCNLIMAKADSTCGYYFTGYGECIVDGGYKIVVGSSNVDLNDTLDKKSCAGIGDYAFAKRQYDNFDVTNNNKNMFAIGKNAFANSNIIRYKEGNCQKTSIDVGAFENCQKLVEVVLNTNCKLETKAFKGCTRLSITLPNDIDIPESCFSNCTSLTSFNVGGNIFENAFEGCTSLSIVRMYYHQNASVIINPTAFINCPITNISVGVSYSDIFGNYAIGHAGLFDRQKETIIVGVQNIDYLFDNHVNTIGEHAYNGRGLNGVITLPASVTRIEDNAFCNNPGITKVIIPSTVEYIGANAFAGCSGLVQVTLPDSCKFIGNGAFKGCSLANGFNMNNADKEYHIPSPSYGSEAIDSIENISTLDLTKCTAYSIVGYECFSNTQIEVVKLPETCNDIEHRAFFQCSYLTELHINSDSLDFGDCSLEGCSRLRDVYFHRNCHFGQSPTDGWCYGVGSSASHKTIHIPPSMNNSIFFNSYFYLAFSNVGYSIIVDM